MKTKVFVMGPEKDAIEACIALKQAGYSPSIKYRAHEAMSAAASSDAVLRLDDAFSLTCPVVGGVEEYAREKNKPVYRSLDQLLAEIEPDFARPVVSRRRRKRDA